MELQRVANSLLFAFVKQINALENCFFSKNNSPFLVHVSFDELVLSKMEYIIYDSKDVIPFYK
jgi:hypothetical protein